MCKVNQKSKIVSKITLFSRCEIFKKFFFKFSKKIFLQISPNYAQNKRFQKFWKYFFEKKNFLKSCFFSENRNKITKNRRIKKMLTVPNRQDFEVFKTYWFFEFGPMLPEQIKKYLKTFSKKIFFSKKCYFGHYFWFLIGFTHTNNLSQVLLSCLLKKFLCDMHTLWVPAHRKSAVCD